MKTYEGHVLLCLSVDLYAHLFIVKKTDISFSSLQPALNRRQNRIPTFLSLSYARMLPSLSVSYCPSYFLAPFYFNFSLLWYFWFGSTLLKVKKKIPWFFCFILLFLSFFFWRWRKWCHVRVCNYVCYLLNWCCNMGKVFCYLVSYFVRTQICLEFFYPCYFWFFWNKPIRRVTYSKLISSILLILVKLHSAEIFYIDIFFWLLTFKIQIATIDHIPICTDFLNFQLWCFGMTPHTCLLTLFI